MRFAANSAAGYRFLNQYKQCNAKQYTCPQQFSAIALLNKQLNTMLYTCSKTVWKHCLANGNKAVLALLIVTHLFAME